MGATRVRGRFRVWGLGLEAQSFGFAQAQREARVEADGRTRGKHTHLYQCTLCEQCNSVHWATVCTDKSQQIHDISQQVKDTSQQIHDISQQVQDISQQVHDISQQVQDISRQVDI